MQRMKSTHQSYYWPGLECFPVHRAHVNILPHPGTPTPGSPSSRCTLNPALFPAAACPLAPLLERALPHGLKTPEYFFYTEFDRGYRSFYKGSFIPFCILCIMYPMIDKALEVFNAEQYTMRLLRLVQKLKA